MSIFSRRSGAPRLAAEFGVIVVGVLVALAVDAAWEQREESGRLTVYMARLESDLRDTSELLDQAISLDSTVVRSARDLNLGMNAQPIEHSDRLDVLLRTAMNSSSYSARTGILQALIQSGDVRLIENPELHSALLSYASAVENLNRNYHGFRATQLEAFGRFARHVNVMTQIGPEADRPDWEVISRDPAATSDVWIITVSAAQRMTLLQELRDNHAGLLEVLEAHRTR